MMASRVSFDGGPVSGVDQSSSGALEYSRLMRSVSELQSFTRTSPNSQIWLVNVIIKCLMLEVR